MATYSPTAAQEVIPLAVTPSLPTALKSSGMPVSRKQIGIIEDVLMADAHNGCLQETDQEANQQC